MKMDLTKFKKIEEDKKGVTLMHPSGHKIKIAKNGISQDTMNQLDAIPVHKALGGPLTAQHDRGAGASKPSKSSNKMPGSPTEAKNNFTEPNAIGTSIPKSQLQGELNDKHFPDVVLSALNKTAPPFGPLGADEKQHYPPCINPSCKSYGKSHPNCLCYGGAGGSAGEQGRFAEGGEVSKEYYCDNNRPHFKKCDYYEDGGQVKPPAPVQPDPEKTATAQDSMRQAFHFKNGGSPAAEMTDSEKLDLAAQQASAGSAPVQQEPPQDPTSQLYGQTSVPPEAPGPGDERPDEPAQQVAAPVNPNPEMNAVAAAPDRAPASDPTNDAPQTQPPTPVEKAQATQSALKDEALKMQSDLDNGHITPETYKDLFEKKDTLGKIGTIFGLLVGGMGSGLTHQPNALLEMMNKQISNDLDAQEKSSSNKQNFLRIAQQGALNNANIRGINIANQGSARALAWSAMARSTLHQQVQAAQRLPEGSPQRQNAMMALSVLSKGIDKKEADMFSQAGLANAMTEASGGAGNTQFMKSGMMGPEFQEIGQDREQKTIPGIPGQATRPIEGKDRDQIQAMNVLSNKAADLMAFAKQHVGTLSPAQIAIGKQKSDEMVNFYNQSLASGALTQGRLGWLDEQIKKNPTGVFTQLMGNNARLAEIKNSNDMRKNLLLKSYGYNIPSPSPSSGSSGMTAKSGREMVQKNGKWYYK